MPKDEIVLINIFVTLKIYAGFCGKSIQNSFFKLFLSKNY